MKKRNNSLERLVLRYCKAANALTDYRRENGFEPGAKVIAQFQKEPAKTGIIAPFGEMWATVDHMHVPILLSEGRLQPWPMSDLTLVRRELKIAKVVQ